MGPGRDGGSGVRGRSRSGPREAVSPPALLSFFIYNPRFGPREGEVRERARVGVRGGVRSQVGGLLDGVRPAAAGCAWGRRLSISLTDWPLPDCFVLGAAGPRQRGRVWLQIPDQCLVYRVKVSVGLITQVESLLLTSTLDD